MGMSSRAFLPKDGVVTDLTIRTLTQKTTLRSISVRANRHVHTVSAGARHISASHGHLLLISVDPCSSEGSLFVVITRFLMLRAVLPCDACEMPGIRVVNAVQQVTTASLTNCHPVRDAQT